MSTPALPHRLSRRALLHQAAGAGGGLASALLAAQWAAASPAPGGRGKPALSASQHALLAAVLERLLPSGPTTPGAREVRAAAYTVRRLSESTADPGDRTLVRDGLAALQARGRAMNGRAFTALTAAEQDAVLRAHQDHDDDGDDLLGVLLVFTLEALLGDPVHGVNPEGVGWRWLNHDPGFPRPAAP